jgi:hypothetical protein
LSFDEAILQDVYSTVYPNKKPTSRILLQVVGFQWWAQLGFPSRFAFGINFSPAILQNKKAACSGFLFRGPSWASRVASLSGQRSPDYEYYFFELLSGPKKSNKLVYLIHLQVFMFLNDLN